MWSNIQKSLQPPILYRLALSGLIVLGLILRLRQYLTARSLWLDEAMLALNIVGRDFAGLLRPLDYNQGGPLGFLLLEKLVLTLLGNHELTLRLLPLLAGCAALPFFALLLRQGLGKTGALTALALFAAGAPLVYYASEVKQYSFDVFIALLLLWLAGKSLGQEKPKKSEENQKDFSDRPERSKNYTGTQGFLSVLRVSVVDFTADVEMPKFFIAWVGALALWCSHPALFVLAGVGTTFLLRDVLQKDWRKLKATLLMTALWAVSFAVLYFVSLRDLAANQFLLDYWVDFFAPMPPWRDWTWFPSVLQAALENPAGLGTWLLPLPAALTLLGTVALLRRQPSFGAMLVLTLLATLGAAVLGKYPFGGRMILFTGPIFLTLISAGVETASGWVQRPGWLKIVVALALAGMLLYQPLVTATENFVSPKYYEHIRPTMAFLQANHKPGDVIYVYYWAVPAFRYYAPFYGFSENDFIAGDDYDNNPSGLLAEADYYKGQKRVWVLFSHVYEKGTYNAKDALLAHLDEIGERKREFVARGTSVSLYLYTLAAGH